jgi:hypothetical protein
MTGSRRTELLAYGVLLFGVCMFVATLHAGNDVLGEIELVGATKVERPLEYGLMGSTWGT